MASTPSWRKEVLEKYEPVRVLGKGDFATVFLAKGKSQAGEGIKDEVLGNEHEEHKLVAIKLVKAKTPTEINYVQREIQILRELNHPHIVKLIESWEPHDSSGTATLALSYAEGKTLIYLLQTIGAPSLTFGRVVIAQLVDAVAYLHSHAVIHRDIKPDNLVIRNIRLDDEAILVGGLEHLPWAALRERWHLTLIDFGFARALGPEDLEAEASLKTLIGATHSSKKKKSDDNSNKSKTHLEEQESIDGAINDASRYFSRNEQLLNDDSSKSGRKGRMNDDSSKSPRKGRMNDDSSKSRRIIRSLSAIGNRTYSAPEVKNKVRRIETVGELRRTREINASTLASFVSDYGLVADAFSVGCTARFLLTGIPAHENVNEFMANHNNLFNKAVRWIGRKVAKRRNVSKPVKKYRPSEDIPIEAVRLIKGMTQPNASLRMTVRGVRLDPYVNDAVGEKTTFRKEMVYLNCAQN